MSPSPLMPSVTIDIWSDVMCPWCVIGFRKLEKGLALLDGEVTAQVRWRPFELNPDMPPEGEDSARHVMRKYGRTADEAAQGRKQISAIAREAGFAFDYTGKGDPPPARLWNTFLAHKLLAHALAACGTDVQTALKLALFGAHFRQRVNVSDRDVLLGIAEAAGLDRAGAERALDDVALGEEVRAEEEIAHDLNITGVPAMLINGKYLVPGAQEPEVYASSIRRVLERESQRA